MYIAYFDTSAILLQYVAHFPSIVFSFLIYQGPSNDIFIFSLLLLLCTIFNSSQVSKIILDKNNSYYEQLVF